MRIPFLLPFLTALMLHVAGLAVLSSGWQAWRESLPRPESLSTVPIAVTPVPEPTPPPQLSLLLSPCSCLMSTRFRNLCLRSLHCRLQSCYPGRWKHHQSRSRLTRSQCQSRRPSAPSCPQPVNAPRVQHLSHQYSARPAPVPRQVSPMNHWGALAVALPVRRQPCQSRKRLSVRSLLRQPASGNCLPMAIYQWRRALAAVGKGLAAVGHMPVLERAAAVVQGREEAGAQAVGLAAGMAPRPVPWVAIRSNRAIQSLPGDGASRGLHC